METGMLGNVFMMESEESFITTDTDAIDIIKVN